MAWGDSGNLAMTDFELASLAIAAVSALAAAVAAFGIWHGIAAMVHANRERAAEARADRQAAAEADDRRHTEIMVVLTDQRRALEAVIRGMETVIERTAPAAVKESA